MITDGVSIVIPVYNTAPYLDRCIASAARQTYRNLEIILIEDGSSDNSPAICAQWQARDRRIRLIRQENRGLGESRNRGLAASRFDFITFLDSDDWLEPAFIASIMDKMLRHHADIGLCDIDYVDSATMRHETAKIRLKQELVSAKEDRTVVNKVRLFLWGKIYKKKLFTEYGVRCPACAFEDTPCTPVLAAQAERIAYVSAPLYNYYRHREGSLSNDPRNISDISGTLRQLYDRFHELDLYGRYELEYKKILLGQLRFACRKWNALADQAVSSALKELQACVPVYFPGLEGICAKKYYICGDELLRRAADKALPLAEQIVAGESLADVILSYGNADSPNTHPMPNEIRLPRLWTSGEDLDTAVYDLAEIMMEEL